jgi:mannose-6-phosphate isomerase-like protein (cupin superfamily)
MAGVHVGDFDSADEVRSPDKARVDVVRMGGAATAARLTLQPGWSWSECIKPIVGTESCKVHHVGFLQSGRMSVRHDDGTEVEIEPGKSYVIEPGHNAWVVGDEPVVAYEFESAAADQYARS